MIVTRFNPSVNGALHIGHAMTLLVNEYFAHSVGGKFYVRFDDTSYPATPGDKLDLIMQHQREDIEWLDVKVDGWLVQSDILPDVRKRLMVLGHETMIDSTTPKLPTFVRFIGTGWVGYPYVPQQISERVVMDALWDVTHLIRGEDFSLEYSFYCFKCEQFKLPVPEFIYLPRLIGKGGEDISKTNGGYTLASLRNDGYTAKDIKTMLAKACLVNANSGWNIYNLKREPRLV